MDQSKTNLPRYPFASKSDSGLTKIHHHVTGVLSHSMKKTYAFTWTDMFPSNCNITLNCLMTVLDDIAKENGGGLPPNTYIQADNAAKDKKNNFVLVFLAMLVKAKLVKKIKFNFLMVGHTHEDVDQFFSRISMKANQVSASTLPDFNKLLFSSVHPSPMVTNLSSLWVVRAIAEAATHRFEDFKDFHTFKFKAIDEDVILSYKNWPLHTEQYRSIKITDILPEPSQPEIVQINTDKFYPLIDKMEADLDSWVKTGRFGSDHHD